jgi:hypothetical protein
VEALARREGLSGAVARRLELILYLYLHLFVAVAIVPVRQVGPRCRYRRFDSATRTARTPATTTTRLLTSRPAEAFALGVLIASQRWSLSGQLRSTCCS